MPTSKASAANEPMSISPLDTETLRFYILGTTPLICNRMSEKARQQLLMPRPRMNAVQKASNLKHDPLEEFRASPYTLEDPNAPTYIAVMASSFKGAMRNAALDIPGTFKSQIGRLVQVNGEYVAVYGSPVLKMDVTRSADAAKTPDVRSRVALPEWCAEITVTFVRPNLTKEGIANLLAAGGITSGIGDWRPEKGMGTFGSYQVVNADNPEFLRRQSEYGRAHQIAAMANPVSYDHETESLLDWYDAEVGRRTKVRGVSAA